MDSLPTNNTTFLHSSPDLNIPTTTTAATATATVTTPTGETPKVPKLEPLDEFLTPHNDTENEEDEMEKQLQLYSEFCRVSNLFREVFGKTLYQQFGNTDFHYDFDSHLVDVKVSVSDPILENGVSDLNFPLLSSINGDPNAGAIVPVSSPHGQGQAVEVTTTPRRNQCRMKELVRTADLGVEEEVHFREVVRKTRMLYESIRVLTSIEDEKRVTAVVKVKKRMIAAVAAGGNGEPEGSVSNVRKSYKRMRLRGDLRAASSMREQGLWLNRDKRIVGAIPGIDVGDIFLFRIELCVLGLHGQIQAGIDYLPGSMSSNGEPIATSVIVSGGYEDDLDDGEVVVYTGQGGQEKNSYKQVSDQKLEGGNLALERSMRYGIEIRVIRGVRYDGSASSSGKVYVYDGLYKIVDCWFDVGRSGFGVYKYKLQRIEGQEKMGSVILKEARDIRRSGIDFHPMHCLSVDISNGQENFPVRLFNDIDDNHDPICFEYITKTTFPQFVFHQSGKATGCDCIDGCAHDCFCFMKNGSEFPYNQHGILVRGKPLIFECGPFCRCPPHCRNRVTQKGLKNRLEVFRSTETKWGVRSLDFIHAGAFICEYAGVVLTREQAQILTMNGCDLPINPNHFSQRWAEWGDISQVYSDFVRPSYPSVPPLDFFLDVSTVRNVACYISHSSTPNVFVQFVLYDHNNLMFPHIMVFAMENIPPMRELSLDYGVADEWTGTLSLCN